jgi:hypothetical protein
MKYYTICWPGEFGQNVQETFSEYQILQSYFDYWSGKMREVGREDQISLLKCIEDWITVHLAVETDQWGNKQRESFDDIMSEKGYQIGSLEDALKFEERRNRPVRKKAFRKY